MSGVCTRCALRLQRAAQAEARQTSKRAFSSTASQQKGLPTFQPTSSPELDTILSDFRSKHILPALLPKPTQRLIFQRKNRQKLTDNPQTAVIGDEEVPLVWMNRWADIPNRTELMKRCLDLMEKGEKRDWQNLRPLLAGLAGCGVKLEDWVLERIVRRAVGAGQLGVVLQCLEQSKETGMTLRRDVVLMNVSRGLREQAQRAKWSAGACKTALAQARRLALLLESPDHGTGTGGGHLSRNDPRQRAEVIGVFVELAAVNAYLHHDKSDPGNAVRQYVARLMSCIGAQTQPRSFAPPAFGPVTEMLDGVPIWHGLRLALGVLGQECPEREQVSKIVADYEAGLSNLANAIEAKGPKEGSYGDQALRVWRECVRE